MVFGLNANSEITYYSNSAKMMWINLLSMHSIGSSQGSTLENSEFLLKVVNEIQDKTPNDFDVVNLKG